MSPVWSSPLPDGLEVLASSAQNAKSSLQPYEVNANIISFITDKETEAQVTRAHSWVITNNDKLLGMVWRGIIFHFLKIAYIIVCLYFCFLPQANNHNTL